MTTMALPLKEIYFWHIMLIFNCQITFFPQRTVNIDLTLSIVQPRHLSIKRIFLIYSAWTNSFQGVVDVHCRPIFNYQTMAYAIIYSPVLMVCSCYSDA